MGRADFVGHQFALLERMDVLGVARPGATLLLNSPYGADEVWDTCRPRCNNRSSTGTVLFVIDGYRVAREAGMGRRINAVMKPCFFALSGVLPPTRPSPRSRAPRPPTASGVPRSSSATWPRSTPPGRLHGCPSRRAPSGHTPPGAGAAPDFVTRVTARMLAGEGDLLPVSALPVDGTFPTGTARWEKRALAAELPVWDQSICIDCGKCAWCALTRPSA